MSEAEALVKQEARRLLEQPLPREAPPPLSRTDPAQPRPRTGTPSQRRPRKRATREEAPYSPSPQEPAPAFGQAPAAGKSEQIPAARQSQEPQAAPQPPPTEPGADLPALGDLETSTPDQAPGHVQRELAPRGFLEPPTVPDEAPIEAQDLLAYLQFDEPGLGSGPPVAAPGEPLPGTQTPATQEPEEGTSVTNLERALNEFLRSIEAPDVQSGPPAPAHIAESQPTSREDTPLRDLESLLEDLETYKSGPAPEPRAAAPAQDIPPRQAAREPRVHTGAEGEDELGEDMLAHLRESLANVTPVSDLPALGDQVPVSKRAAEAPHAQSMQITPPEAAPVQDLEFGGMLPLEGSGSGPTQPGNSQSILQAQDWNDLPRTQPLGPAPGPSPAPSGGAPPAASYTGILQIVVSPFTDSAALSLFWDAVDSVAGVGKIVDQVPLPDGSGHELTLDLGEDILVVEHLAGRLPGCEISSMGPDRLQIHLGNEAP